eukprot:352387-Prorocentrum_minimum.AAC.5
MSPREARSQAMLGRCVTIMSAHRSEKLGRQALCYNYVTPRSETSGGRALCHENVTKMSPSPRARRQSFRPPPRSARASPAGGGTKIQYRRSARGFGSQLPNQGGPISVQNTAHLLCTWLLLAQGNQHP